MCRLHVLLQLYNMGSQRRRPNEEHESRPMAVGGSGVRHSRATRLSFRGHVNTAFFLAICAPLPRYI